MFKDILVELKTWVVFANARYEFGRELDLDGLADWIADAFWWQNPENPWLVKYTDEALTIVVPRTLLSLRLRPVYAGFGAEAICWLDATVPDDADFCFLVRDHDRLVRLASVEAPILRLRFVEDWHAKAIPELMAILPKV